MKSLFEFISGLLLSIENVNTVSVWNNQIQNEDKELIPFLPALFFSAKVNWSSATSNVRMGEAVVTIYIVTEIYETGVDIDTQIAFADLVDDVAKKLVKNGFVSVSDIPDENHDNVQVHVSTFTVAFSDSTLKRTNQAGQNLLKIVPKLTIEK